MEPLSSRCLNQIQTPLVLVTKRHYFATAHQYPVWKGLVAIVYLQARGMAASWNPYRSQERCHKLNERRNETTLQAISSGRNWGIPARNYTTTSLVYWERKYPFLGLCFWTTTLVLGFLFVLNKAYAVCYFLISSRHKSSLVRSDTVILSILKSSEKNITGIFILSNNYMHIF